jgi:tRNA1(Val) A37 N6-methylase TrmN6
LVLAQPASGHRVGTDTALLAMSVTPRPGQTVYDLGAGVGAVGLSLAARVPGCRVVLVERDGEIAALARFNTALNALEGQVEVIEADLTARGAPLPPRGADIVVMNPPHHLAGRVRPSPSDSRRVAHQHAIQQDAAWLRRAASLLAAQGRLALIHRADALARLLEAMAGRFGDIRIKPVEPRANEPATRILVRACKGSRAPLVLLPPLVLHASDGSFAAEADALHRGEATIDWLDRR